MLSKAGLFEESCDDGAFKMLTSATSCLASSSLGLAISVCFGSFDAILSAFLLDFPSILMTEIFW